MFEKEEPEIPIEVVKDWKGDDPIGREEDANTETHFAIMRTTDGGKWMRGNRLFYELNGVSVYTDPKNIIFVDLNMKSMVIKEYDKVLDEIQPKDPESKEYIVLYVDLGYEEADEGFPLRWESYEGRTNTYDGCVANAPVIDLDKSIVLVENVPIDKAATVRQFIEFMKNSGYVDDSLDLSIYD
jgi:hypothetical protein